MRTPRARCQLNSGFKYAQDFCEVPFLPGPTRRAGMSYCPLGALRERCSAALSMARQCLRIRRKPLKVMQPRSVQYDPRRLYAVTVKRSSTRPHSEGKGHAIDRRLNGRLRPRSGGVRLLGNGGISLLMIWFK